MTASRVAQVSTITEVHMDADFTLARADHNHRFVATASLTISLPVIGVLGDGFECEVVNDSGFRILIDSPTPALLNDGDIAVVVEANGDQLVANTTNLPLQQLVEVPKSTSFTLSDDNTHQRFVATAGITITVPDLLVNGFECEVVNDSGDSVIIDGIESTNVTMSDGDIATIYGTNSKQRVEVEASTVVGDRFSEDALWDPSVFGTMDLIRWWDATTKITPSTLAGHIKQWNDIVGDVGVNQSELVKQATWLNNDEVRLEGLKIGHNMNVQGRAVFESKWVMMLFRFNWTTMASGTQDTYFLTVNGTSSINGQRQPQFKYLRATHQIETIWQSDGGPVSVIVDVPGADDTWHSLVCRRTDDHIYASIDGAAEVSLACYPRAFLDTGSQPVGYIGNPVVNTRASIGIDSVVWGQREISPDEIAAAHAWMLWKRGAEASLDASSPYLSAAPLMSYSDMHIAEPDSFADGFRFSLSSGWDETVRGDTMDFTGFTRTFHDHFTSLSTVTSGLTGAGPWYAPAHIDTSGAKFRRPDQTPLDTWTLLSDNTTLQIKIQKLNTDPLNTQYASGHMQTVDSWRNGFSQAVPPGGASYFEASMAFNGIGTDPAGNTVTPAPSWPAFWLYTVLDTRDSAATKAEIDILEAYGDRDPSIYEIHCAPHRHAAYRPQPGNAGTVPGTISHPSSQIIDVRNAPWSITGSLFDGQGPGLPGTFHLYSAMIDETWITWYFDRILIARHPVYKEALGPLYMLVNLQSQDLKPDGIPGQGGGTPNCTSYMWVDYVDAWSKS